MIRCVTRMDAHSCRSINLSYDMRATAKLDRSQNITGSQDRSIAASEALAYLGLNINAYSLLFFFRSQC